MCKEKVIKIPATKAIEYAKKETGTIKINTQLKVIKLSFKTR